MARTAKKEEAVTLSSKDKFMEDYAILSGAAVGVVVLRTKEPYRMMDALKDFSREKSMQFSVWKITNGWNKYKLNAPVNEGEEDRPDVDNMADIVPALRTIGEFTPKENDAAKGYMYAMMWPHHFVGKNAPTNIPVIIQYLAEYALMFTEQKKRLVLVVPVSYTLPVELEDCVTLIDVDLPTQDELRDSLDDLFAFVQAKKEIKMPFNEADKNRILSAGAGMTTTEFETTLSRALCKFKAELKTVSIDDFVRFVSVTKAELVKRSEVLELMHVGSMQDVGGLGNLKKWIELRKNGFDKEARAFGVDKPRGCALIGPPGTGKSLCAKAVAHTLGLPLIRFDVSRVFSQYVGSSEGRVREALATIRAMSPCVVMLDEVDKAFNINSGGGDSGVGQRVLGSILTEMQENSVDNFWIMTANRVSGLPPELLRKGRLDEVFSVTVPDEQERMDILRIHLKKRKQNPDEIKGLDKVIDATAGFVGAEIEAAVAESVLIAYADDAPVTAELIAQQFENSVPLSEAHADQFNEMKTWAENNARPASGNGSGKPGKVQQRSRNRSVGSDTLGRRHRQTDIGI